MPAPDDTTARCARTSARPFAARLETAHHEPLLRPLVCHSDRFLAAALRERLVGLEALEPDGLVKYRGGKPRGFAVLTARPNPGRARASQANVLLLDRPTVGRLGVTPERSVRP